MKIMLQFTALLILSLFVVSDIQAQRWGGTPEENARAQTQRMTDSLTLSSAQVVKVEEINLKYANLQADFRSKARDSEEFDREAMRAGMKKLRDEQKTELKKILTSDQFDQFEKMEAARRENREGKRGGKKGKRKPKENRS